MAINHFHCKNEKEEEKNVINRFTRFPNLLNPQIIFLSVLPNKL